MEYGKRRHTMPMPMACLVCRGDLLDEDALTCTACREFAVGRRLHAGHGVPPEWADRHLEFSTFITRLDELAHDYCVPPPLHFADCLGAWAHFVQALHAYHQSNYEIALREARLAQMLRPPRGWKGLGHHAAILAKASEVALVGGDRRLPRRYKAKANITYPSLPTDADLHGAEWQSYGIVMDHLRANRLVEAYAAIYAGLNKLGGPESTHPAAWYLKQLGHAITRARKPRPLFDLKAQPSRTQDRLAVHAHFAIPVPDPEVLENPAWGGLLRAWIAHDNGAWQAAYAHIDEARSLLSDAPQSATLDRELLGLEQRIPVQKRPAKYAVKRNGRIHIPSFAKLRQRLR